MTDADKLKKEASEIVEVNCISDFDKDVAEFTVAGLIGDVYGLLSRAIAAERERDEALRAKAIAHAIPAMTLDPALVEKAISDIVRLCLERGYATNLNHEDWEEVLHTALAAVIPD